LRREIQEELGVNSFDILELVDYDIWYVKKDKHRQGVCALLFLIDNLDTYNIKLSHEHLQYKWVSLDKLPQEKFFWPGAHRMLTQAFKRYQEIKNKK
jgi:8-oxo-dGTP pyrophosphatase MutT (NUDIX family)